MRTPPQSYLRPLNPYNRLFVPPHGQKQVYLPNFTLTLLRTPFLPPTFASFFVPVRFNKLDLKDYLWHLYGVRCLSVRSYVLYRKVQLDDRRYYGRREKARKKMTVEMIGPEGYEKSGAEFVWPEEVGEEQAEAFDKATFDAVEKQQKESNENMRLGQLVPPQNRKSIAQQARDLREGKVKWTSTVAGLAEAGAIG